MVVLFTFGQLKILDFSRGNSMLNQDGKLKALSLPR
jgi:hypothetical protein